MAAAALQALKNANEQRASAAAEMELAGALMKKAFDHVDKDKSGKLDLGEMMEALKKCGEYEETDVKARVKAERMVTKAAGSDKEFNFEEFKAFIVLLRKEKNKWNVTVDLPLVAEARKLYQTQAVQLSVAAVIVVNFLVMVFQSELDAYPEENQQSAGTWKAIDKTCNVIFLFELLLNLYGSFWRPFVKDAWNYLDTVVVIVGVCDLAEVDLGPLASLKLLRAFRILRLFKRVESLNKILVALVRSIPGVLNAFLVMFIFMAIYAVLAVDLFRDFGASGTYETIQRYGPSDATWGLGIEYLGEGVDPKARHEVKASVSAMTARGFHYGQEYFGTFSRSLYTLFQVLTGESWSEAVARPLLFGGPDGSAPESALVSGLFFVSYILLTAIILQNVVVTVLLDNFLVDDSKEKAEEMTEDARMAQLMMKLDSEPAPASAPPRPAPVSAAGGGASSSSDEFAVMRLQADKLQSELASSLTQMQEILKLLPEKAVLTLP